MSSTDGHNVAGPHSRVPFGLNVGNWGDAAVSKHRKADVSVTPHSGVDMDGTQGLSG